MRRSDNSYWLVSFKIGKGACGWGNMLRVQNEPHLTAISLREINTGIRQLLDEDPKTRGDSFCVVNISFLGSMTPEMFGDVNSWQQVQLQGL